MIRTALDWAVTFCDPNSPDHVTETNGNNRSPAIDAINRLVGNPLASPYCAAGVSYCFHKVITDPTEDPHATATKFFPFSGSSQDLMKWFKAKGLLSTDPNSLKHWQGALAGWTDADDVHGHIFFVKNRLTGSDGRVLAIETAEFNTSAQTGSRDGEGAFLLKRVVPVDRGHSLRFLNVSDFTGGNWWKSPG